MTIVDGLRDEHAVLRRLMNDLEGPTPAQHAVLELGAALKAHEGLEEMLLFRELEASASNRAALAVMREEHAAIDAAVEWLSEHQSSHADWRPTLTRLLAVLRSHMVREEMTVFPLASRQLSANRLQFLGEALVGLRARSGALGALEVAGR